MPCSLCRWLPGTHRLDLHELLLCFHTGERKWYVGRLGMTHEPTVLLNELHVLVLTQMSQKPLGCKRPFEIIWSNPPGQAGSPRAGCPGLCPVRFWTSSRMVTPPPLWVTCLTTLTVKSVFLCSEHPQIAARGAVSRVSLCFVCVLRVFCCSAFVLYPVVQVFQI